MFEVGVAAGFEAVHRLEDEATPGEHQHDHAYRVEVSVRGDGLDDNGMLLDIDRLSAALSACLADLASADLDALPAFRGQPTTVEILADHIWGHVRQELATPSGLRTLRVTVFESPDAWASVDKAIEA